MILVYSEWKIVLKEAGLGKYIDKFEEEEFTYMEDWPDMEDEDLLEMGMKKGSIKKFRKTFPIGWVIAIFFLTSQVFDPSIKCFFLLQLGAGFCFFSKPQLSKFRGQLFFFYDIVFFFQIERRNSKHRSE